MGVGQGAGLCGGGSARPGKLDTAQIVVLRISAGLEALHYSELAGDSPPIEPWLNAASPRAQRALAEALRHSSWQHVSALAGDSTPLAPESLSEWRDCPIPSRVHEVV